MSYEKVLNKTPKIGNSYHTIYRRPYNPCYTPSPVNAENRGEFYLRHSVTYDVIMVTLEMFPSIRNIYIRVLKRQLFWTSAGMSKRETERSGKKKTFY